MWETINKDPLIRSIIVIILGVLGFGFAFNIMFGNSYTSAYAVNALLKIAILALFTAGALKLYRYIDSKLMDSSGADCTKGSMPVKSKGMLIVIAALAVIILIFTLSTPGAFTPNVQATGYYNTNHMNQGYGITTFNILAVLAKILMFISGLGLIIGLTSYFINVSKSANCKVTDDNQTNNTEKKSCNSCGTDLHNDWLCCPKCGADAQELEVSVEDTAAAPEIAIEKENELSEEELKEMKAINEVYKNIHSSNKKDNKNHKSKSVKNHVKSSQGEN